MGQDKIGIVKSILSSMGEVLIAYSGGVDSTLLLKIAKEVLGDKVLAVTARSETYPEEEIEAAVELAKSLGVKHQIIETKELEDERFISNPSDRCYFCKQELFSNLIKMANGSFVLDGAHFDDLKDHRPGKKAAEELGVRSPLQEAKLTKEEIRAVSRELNLPTWNKPSLACLASRFPYGMRLTRENLKKVAEAERYLKSLGLKQVRVRHHSDSARIEVPKENIPLLFKKHKEIIGKLKNLGYTYITVDLEGYRSGSMNEVLRR